MSNALRVQTSVLKSDVAYSVPQASLTGGWSAAKLDMLTRRRIRARNGKLRPKPYRHDIPTLRLSGSDGNGFSQVIFALVGRPANSLCAANRMRPTEALI